jgi:inosose dehydratase
MAQAGGVMLVLALLADERWGAPRELDGDGWRRLAANVSELRGLAAEWGLQVALHPHVGTLVETAPQVRRALAELEVGWCLDTGHLMIGGTDPSEFARRHGDRVTHVHLKDVDADIAAALTAGRMSLVQATQAGLFVPLGHGAGVGGGRILETLQALNEHGYDGWLVLEQDTAITADEPAVTSAPMLAATQSIAFLNTAHTTEEINR